MSGTLNTIAQVACLIGLGFVVGFSVALFLVRRAKGQMSDVFTSLATQVLQDNSETFVQMAKGELEKTQVAAEGDLAQRQLTIKSLVDPLKEQLEKYQQRLQQNETAQASAVSAVETEVKLLSQESKSLATETQQLRMVLKSNQARGRWGEETLHRVVEAAGMSPHCDFYEQTQSGNKKPDLIVRLPGDRSIIVDAKVPDLDFLTALDTADATKRSEVLALHARKLRAAIDLLADRDYPSEFKNALDYVVLFVPAESLFSAALEGDPDLIVWAAAKHILLATPASLIALLASVSVSWQQYKQTENTREIAEAARELYKRVVTFTDHFENIRDGLEKAGEAFNRSVGSYEWKVRPAGERIQTLRAAVGEKQLADIRPLDSTLSLPPTSASQTIAPNNEPGGANDSNGEGEGEPKAAA
jgi:DNA recombination protein RmuC